VEQSGDLVRVTARLVDATDMTQLASIRVQQPRGELFALQDSLVADVLRGLRRQLGRDIRLDLARRATTSVEAWELVQRAEKLRDQAWEGRSDTEVAAGLRVQADSILARAEELDKRWTEPILLRGRLALETGTAEALGRGLGHMTRAMALSPGEARALGLQGSMKYALARQASDSLSAAELLDQAEQDLRTALAENASLASAWIALADLLYNAKWDLAAARDAARRAYEEDVFLLEEDHFVWMCEISMQLGDYAEATRWCAEGRRRSPSRQRLPMVELVVLASEGVKPDPAAAWKRVDELARLSSPEVNVPLAQMVTAAVLVRAELPDSARAVMRSARSAVPDDYATAMAYYEAHVRLLLGERETTLRLLREFLTAYPAPYRAVVARDYWFEDLARDPRFEALVDRRRLPFFCQILCEPPPQ
jgi:tetratricopeptide (TPR) repeat protein